jgi:hypothetical protein
MRRLLLSLALVLMLSALGASSALAKAPKGAQKAPLYGPSFTPTCEGGAAPTTRTFGIAVLNTPGDETTLSGVISLKGAEPNATYVVDPTQAPLGPCAGTTIETIRLLHTNGKGNGTVEFSGPRDPGTTEFWVELFNEAPPFDEYASPAVELD